LKTDGRFSKKAVGKKERKSFAFGRCLNLGRTCAVIEKIQFELLEMK